MIPGKVRIDKWLWAVRIFKTRALAAGYCEKGKVSIGQQVVKSSRLLKKDEIIFIRKGAFTLRFRVLELTGKRLPAKQAPDFCREVTPSDEIERIKTHSIAVRAYRMPGEGRPTKKERRTLDDFLDWD